VAVSSDLNTYSIVDGSVSILGSGFSGNMKRAKNEVTVQKISITAKKKSDINIDNSTCYVTIARKTSRGTFSFIRVSRKMDVGATWTATDAMFQAPIAETKSF
jgi:hypothetical protein